MRYICILLLAVCALHDCIGVTQYSLNGDDWILMQVSRNITVEARVPGSVHTDLFRNGVIGDPYYRFNDIEYRWIGLSDWYYSKTFTVDDKTFQFQQHHLVFGGLDTVATVVLNDVPIGNTFNMFRRYDFNVTDILKHGLNQLYVHFKSPVLYAKERAQQYPYVVPPECPPSVQKGECHFNFIRKEASSFSWDWGPSYPTIGIWKNVTLMSYNNAAISYVTAETSRSNATSWELKIKVFFDGWASGLLYVIIDELNAFHLQHISSQSIYVTIPVTQVQMWWPNGYGRPVLYTASVLYKGSSGDVDSRTLKIGFRTVELVQSEVNRGKTFYFKINEVPIFAKGSNWIPADSFQERIKRSYVEQLLRSAVEANMNILRVWGGGVYESEDFYQLADELGIMIWQDFMFACALYPTDSDFTLNVWEEVVHQVRRLKRHPSIVLWSGNNENEGALSNNWFDIKPADYPRYYTDYVKLYVTTIRYAVLHEDTSRPFVTSSPSNGDETIAEGWVAKDPQSPFYGDVHDYDYSRDSWNWQRYLVPRFSSEFGLQSWCSLETLAPVSLPSFDWNVNSTFVNHRQHHGDGELQMINELAMHLKPPGSKNATTNFEYFIYLTQINQAMGIKTEVELYRRSQSCLQNGSGLTMGALYWQLNDIWQAPTWASIEYGGKWKMLHYFAKKFFNRQLVSPYVDGDNLTVFYVDDGALKTVMNINCTSEQTYQPSTFSNSEQKNRAMPGTRTRENNFVHEFHQQNAASDKLEAKVLQMSSVVRGRCYKWDSFTAYYEWNITFQKDINAAQRVYSMPLSLIRTQCQCSNAADCFFHFTDLTSSADDASLFLTNLTEVNITQTNIEVVDVKRIDQTTAEIQLHASGVSLFVWLNSPGFSGRFSDNGFLMEQPGKSVKFHSWTTLSDIDMFKSKLTVHSLSNVVYG